MHIQSELILNINYKLLNIHQSTYLTALCRVQGGYVKCIIKHKRKIIIKCKYRVASNVWI